MQKDNCVTAGNITEEVRTESEYQVLSQKLTALPSPQKMRWKIRIFHTHGKCYLPKEHPFLLSSQKPNAWSHQGDNECSKAHHIKARGARQFLNLCHVIHPHDFPFHSFQKHPENHSSCRLLQQPQKKDRLSHKCKIVFRVCFFLLARIKAGAMAQQELFGTAMGDTLITAMAPEWKYLVHRERKTPVAWEGEAAHRDVGMGQHGKAVPVSVVPKSASGRVLTAGTRHL